MVAQQSDPLSGTVFDIKRFSIHDGPGIRTTVFLKGCPLHCAWCHNPEGISLQPEIHFWAKRCIACHECLQACPNGALSWVAGQRVHQTALCQGCGFCAEACPAEATELVGTRMGVPDVLREIEKDLIIYDQSGGGATFSGGEPLLQIDFLEALLIACKDHDIHTVVDTSGHVRIEHLERIKPLVDIFLYDIKLMDPDRHFQYTGVPNRRILNNLMKLAKTGTRVIARVPIIPGINDDEVNIDQTGHFLASLTTIRQVNILPYHRSAADKYQRMQHFYPLSDLMPPSDHHISQIAERLESYGLTAVIGG
ncbi:MAG: glycyl-radical enzyme activating protein [Anaerolineales bacterium]|nr:glycyl-radical enzyme activating protein [Anaerolineales bacterium]